MIIIVGNRISNPSLNPELNFQIILTTNNSQCYQIKHVILMFSGSTCGVSAGLQQSSK